MVELGSRPGVDEADVASRVMGDEVVVVNLRTGVYYSVPGAGAVVWELVRTHHDAAEITTAVAELFDESPDRVRGDVETFLKELAAEDLLVASDRSAPDDVEVGGIVDDYGAMALERFDDIEELLALDPPTPGALDNLMRQPYADDGG